MSKLAVSDPASKPFKQQPSNWAPLGMSPREKCDTSQLKENRNVALETSGYGPAASNDCMLGGAHVMLQDRLYTVN